MLPKSKDHTNYKRCLILFIQFSNDISNLDDCDKLPRRIHSELIALQFSMLFFSITCGFIRGSELKLQTKALKYSKQNCKTY